MSFFKTFGGNKDIVFSFFSYELDFRESPVRLTSRSYQLQLNCTCLALCNKARFLHRGSTLLSSRYARYDDTSHNTSGKSSQQTHSKHVEIGMRRKKHRWFVEHRVPSRVNNEKSPGAVNQTARVVGLFLLH